MVPKMTQQKTKRKNNGKTAGYSSFIICIDRDFVLWGIHFIKVRNEQQR